MAQDMTGERRIELAQAVDERAATRKTSAAIRVAAVVGTLLMVGLIAIYLVFGAAGLLNGPSFSWSAGLESLAHVLLFLVIGGYLFLHRRWLEQRFVSPQRAVESATEGPQPVTANLGLLLVVLGALLGFVLAYFVEATAADAGDGFRIAAEVLSGLCLAILIFGPRSVADVIRSTNPSTEEPALSFYFGLLLGILVYLMLPWAAPWPMLF